MRQQSNLGEVSMSDVANALELFFKKSSLPVLFAGAGVSARAGLPTWGTYLSSLGAAVSGYDQFTKYFIDKAVNDGALEDAATYYLMCRDMPESSKYIELVRPLKDYDASLLSAFAELPFSAFVTTNFDRALIDAYAKHVGRAAVEVNIDDPTLDYAAFADNFYVARIHGRVEVPKSMRLSRQHLEVLPTNASYTNYLKHLFTRRQVLFVGFSFLDPAISAVLRSVRSDTGSMHGQEHLALIPSNAPGDFIKSLSDHSIRKIEYDPASQHVALWFGLQAAANQKVVALVRDSDVRLVPFRIAKKYLATAFARVRVGGSKGPLARAISEGVVSGIIRHSQAAGITETELVSKLQSELSIDSALVSTLVSQSVTALARDGLCYINTQEQPPRFVAKDQDANSYDVAIDRLVEGVISRFILREKGIDSPVIRVFLSDFFKQLVLKRGWDLGAAYAARRMPDDVDVFDVMDTTPSSGINEQQIRRLARVVEDMLERPDDDEATVLAELGRLAFGLELFLEAPHDGLFFQRTLPERIYLDANVLMPAITRGHPHYDLFRATLTSLLEAASNAVLKVSLRVYFGFLNEIISHRQLAVEAMAENSGEGSLWAERSAGLLGTANVNVFIGAYFNYRETKPEVCFSEFLTEVAPYGTETELKNYLEKMGFEIIRDGQSLKRESGPLLHALEKFYAGKLEHKQKSSIVVAHDAAQLGLLNADLYSNIRSVFVSADRGLRLALEEGGFSSISNSIVTHVGLAQLVELLIGRLPAPRGMASLLWMSSVSGDTDRIRNYLISLALKEHDVAMAMAMGDVVDTIVEDASMELESKGISINRGTSAARLEFNQVMDKYEADFFKKMNIEAKKYVKR